MNRPFVSIVNAGSIAPLAVKLNLFRQGNFKLFSHDRNKVRFAVSIHEDPHVSRNMV